MILEAPPGFEPGIKPRIDPTLHDLGSQLRFEWGVGIDVGEVIAVKGGMRGDDNSDLVWAGAPVNHAVKISSLAAYPYTLYVSDEVYQQTDTRLREDGQIRFWEHHHWVEKARDVWRCDWNFGPGYLRDVPTNEPPSLQDVIAEMRLRRRLADLAAPPSPPDFNALGQILRWDRQDGT
jgi:hypothetical protein